MLTFSHDTRSERQVSKDGNTHFTVLAFSCDTLTRRKKPQKLEHVKCFVESSAAGFTQIRPALTRGIIPLKAVASGFTLHIAIIRSQKGDLWNVPYLTQFLHLQRRKPTFDT